MVSRMLSKSETSELMFVTSAVRNRTDSIRGERVSRWIYSNLKSTCPRVTGSKCSGLCVQRPIPFVAASMDSWHQLVLATGGDKMGGEEVLVWARLEAVHHSGVGFLDEPEVKPWKGMESSSSRSSEPEWMKAGAFRLHPDTDEDIFKIRGKARCKKKSMCYRLLALCNAIAR
jgi:hypothetical protein